MVKWFKFLHQVCILVSIGLCVAGASAAFSLAKWESQDYTLVAFAVLIVAGIFKGMSEPPVPQEEIVGKDSNKEPALSVP